MTPNLNHHQWKIVFNAVRKQQHRHLPDSKWYNEHTAILNEIYDLAFSENYIDNPIVDVSDSKRDWDEFWDAL